MNREEKKNIIIFGTGKYGEIAAALLESEYNIVAYADNNKEKWNQEFCQRLIIPPSAIPSYTFDKVVIASQYYILIAKQLYEMGISSVETFHYKGNISDNIYHSDYILIKNIPGTLYETRGEVKRNKVLMCAYIFPPLGGPGSQRATKFVKYLRKYGYEPVVVTVGSSDSRTVRDESLLKDIPDGVEIIRIDNDIFLPEQLSEEEKRELLNIYYGIVNSGEWLQDYVDKINNNLNQYRDFFVPDIRICWAVKVLKNILGKINISEFAACYTTGTPFSDFIIGYYIKKLYGLPWIMDYRDPWTMDEYFNKKVYTDRRNTLELEKVLEKSLLKYADAVINVTEGYCQEMMEQDVCDGKRLYCITNGYDEEDFEGIDISCNKEIFTICYNGTLYCRYRDNYDIILDVLNELMECGQIDSGKCEFIINGRSEDKKIYDMLKEKDKYRIIRFNGVLEHDESIKSAMQSDLLVQFGSRESRKGMGYGGKIFEYLRMKRPILALSGKETILEELLEKTGCGKSFAYDEILEIKKYILDIYGKWKNKTEYNEFNIQEIQKYSRVNTTRQLADIIKKISNDVSDK